jgi:hypothetical protein
MPNSRWQTQVKVEPSPFKLNHADSILALGSCFAEHVGEHLRRSGFEVLINPFGILFNPSSILIALNRILDKRLYTADDLTHYDGKYVSLDHHGKFNSTTAEATLNKINDSLISAHERLLEAKMLVITFGSAWGYEFNETKRVVANCHKIPQAKFSKVLLDHQRIAASFDQLLAKVWQSNPALNVVFTVSPVRHWKDGAEGNSISKSHLRLAAAALSSKTQCHYFPAFEIVIDELRDYRFFADDLLHPSALAVDYVWEKFSGCYMEAAVQHLAMKVAKLNLTLAHKSESPEAKLLKEKAREEIRVLLSR